MVTTQTLSRHRKFIEDRGPTGLWADYYYDKSEALRAVRFIEKQLRHTEGKHSGLPFVLEHWQRKIVLKFFGWRRKDNHRRKYRVLFLFLPRKNGKTAFAAAIGLYAQFADRESAAQVVCAASDKDQARWVFNMASGMVKSNRLLSSMAQVFKTSIYAFRSRSVFKVLSKSPNTKHGANIHCAIIDEVHAIEDRELVDVLTTGTIARTQPIVVYASTAGFDKTHFFYGLYEYAKAIAANPDKDPTWLPVIYEADPEKWKDPEEWKRCNPNFGVTMDMESFMQDFRLALEIPAYENTFKRLRLNIWTEQDSRAIPMDKWALCIKNPDLAPLHALEGQECFYGLDLASTTDLAAGALLFPPDGGERTWWDILMRYWFPEHNIVVRRKRLGAQDVEPWGRDKHIEFTEGSVIDYDRIRTKVNEDSTIYNIREVAIDRWNATQLSTQLDGDGLTVVPTGMGYATMSDPTKFFLGLILGQKINHRGNPVLEWNARNLATEEDAAGNLKPSKKRSKEKIDGMVAVILALSCANRHDVSAYATSGIRVIG